MSNEFVVVVTFATTAESHQRATEVIGDYVGSFLSQQPGFIESWLTEKDDGSGLLHFARWQQESDFRAFAEKAQDHPALPEIRQFTPSAIFYQKLNHYVGVAE